MQATNEQLIIDLIQQDLRHCQLMHISSEKKNDYLAETYAAFMSMATDYEITTNRASLRSLAKDCYHRLKYLVEL